MAAPPTDPAAWRSREVWRPRDGRWKLRTGSGCQAPSDLLTAALAVDCSPSAVRMGGGASGRALPRAWPVERPARALVPVKASGEAIFVSNARLHYAVNSLPAFRVRCSSRVRRSSAVTRRSSQPRASSASTISTIRFAGRCRAVASWRCERAASRATFQSSIALLESSPTPSTTSEGSGIACTCPVTRRARSPAAAAAAGPRNPTGHPARRAVQPPRPPPGPAAQWPAGAPRPRRREHAHQRPERITPAEEQGDRILDQGQAEQYQVRVGPRLAGVERDRRRPGQHRRPRSAPRRAVAVPPATAATYAAACCASPPVESAPPPSFKPSQR